MNIETLVADTFAAHEHLTPDEHDVMAAVRRRLDGRRDRRGFVQPLAVAASIAVVAGTAIGVVAITNRTSSQPAQQLNPAVSSTQQAPAPAAIPLLTMPFDLGWLPDGTVSYLARRINVGAVHESGPPVFGGEYMLTVTTPSAVVNIDVQQMPGGLDGAGFKSGPGTSVRIGGRDGVQSTNSAGPGGYEVYFVGSAGGVVYVNVSAPHGGTVPADQLVAIGRKVAENVRFPGTAQVVPTFGVGYVPAGLRVRAFGVNNADAGRAPLADGGGATTWTSYDLGTSTELDPNVNIGTNAAGPATGTPGRAVQGHPTRHGDEGGYHTLFVLDAVHGQTVRLSGRVDLSELYKIADGLVLPD